MEKPVTKWRWSEAWLAHVSGVETRLVVKNRKWWNRLWLALAVISVGTALSLDFRYRQHTCSLHVEGQDQSTSPLLHECRHIAVKVTKEHITTGQYMVILLALTSCKNLQLSVVPREISFRWSGIVGDWIPLGSSRAIDVWHSVCGLRAFSTIINTLCGVKRCSGEQTPQQFWNEVLGVAQ